jgi:hypothetical protein
MRAKVFALIPLMAIFILGLFLQTEAEVKVISRENYGPFQLGNGPGGKVTVEVQIVEQSESDIIVIVDIKDTHGTQLFHRDIPDGGEDHIEVWPEEVNLPGSRKALLLIESWIPIADTLGMYGQYFGFDSSGKFVRFSGKIFNNSGGLSFLVIEKTLNGRPALLIEVSEWVGYFFVTFHYPLNLDGYVSDEASPISYKNLPIKISISSKDAEENRKACREANKGEELSVFLFKEPGNANLSPTKVLIRPESTVDFIDATFTNNPKGGRGDLWLRVRIDGQEGYVQESPEDFPKLGLISAG